MGVMRLTLPQDCFTFIDKLNNKELTAAVSTKLIEQINGVKYVSVRSFMTVSQLFGLNVINSQKKDIGKIKEFIVNLHSGKITYAIVSFGGFLGTAMGDKLFAIPFRLIKMHPAKDYAVLDIPKSLLKKAPGFDKHERPDFNSAAWAGTVDSYFISCMQDFMVDEPI